MEECFQGAFVFLYKKKDILILSFSRSSEGIASGHGKFEKLMTHSSSTDIGAALRRRIEDRKDGHHVPHMWKERDAYLAHRKSYEEDRGGMSENQFRKHSSSFHVNLREDGIQFEVYEGISAKWVPLLTLPLDASDEELGNAVKNTCEHIVTVLSK